MFSDCRRGQREPRSALVVARAQQLRRSGDVTAEEALRTSQERHRRGHVPRRRRIAVGKLGQEISQPFQLPLSELESCLLDANPERVFHSRELVQPGLCQVYPKLIQVADGEVE